MEVSEQTEKTDVKPVINGETSKSQKTTAARRKLLAARRRAKKRTKARFSADSEDEKLKNRLIKKAKSTKKGSVKSKQQDTAPLVHEIKTKKPNNNKETAADFRRFEIVNPESYKRLVCRFEENQINKAPKPNEGEFVESRWICALCQKPSTNVGLGDLFGPYYCKIGDNFWPPYLKSKTKKQNIYTDFWFHGYCALWASGILAKGNVLTGLEEHLPDYWKHVMFF